MCMYIHISSATNSQNSRTCLRQAGDSDDDGGDDDVNWIYGSGTSGRRAMLVMRFLSYGMHVAHPRVWQGGPQTRPKAGQETTSEALQEFFDSTTGTTLDRANEMKVRKRVTVPGRVGYT